MTLEQANDLGTELIRIGSSLRLHQKSELEPEILHSISALVNYPRRHRAVEPTIIPTKAILTNIEIHPRRQDRSTEITLQITVFC